PKASPIGRSLNRSSAAGVAHTTAEIGGVLNREALQHLVTDARARTFDIVRDLSDEQFCVPLLRTINPFLWEIGHVAYFQEYWVLRHAAGGSPLHADADALYDSAKVAHDTRWSLPLPARAATIEYLETVRDKVLD